MSNINEERHDELDVCLLVDIYEGNTYVGPGYLRPKTAEEIEVTDARAPTYRRRYVFCAESRGWKKLYRDAIQGTFHTSRYASVYRFEPKLDTP